MLALTETKQMEMEIYIPNGIAMTTRFGWGQSIPSTEENLREYFPLIGEVYEDQCGQLKADWSAYQHLFALSDWAGKLNADRWALAAGFDLLVDALAAGRVPTAEDITSALANGAEEFLLIASASGPDAYPWDCLPAPRVQPEIPNWDQLEYLLANDMPKSPETVDRSGPILNQSTIGWTIGVNPYA